MLSRTTTLCAVPTEIYCTRTGQKIGQRCSFSSVCFVTTLLFTPLLKNSVHTPRSQKWPCRLRIALFIFDQNKTLGHRSRGTIPPRASLFHFFHQHWKWPIHKKFVFNLFCNQLWWDRKTKQKNISYRLAVAKVEEKRKKRRVVESNPWISDRTFLFRSDISSAMCSPHGHFCDRAFVVNYWGKA